MAGSETATASRLPRLRSGSTPLAHQLLVDEIERQSADVERFEVEQREAEGAGREFRDVERAHLAARDQLLDEARAVTAGEAVSSSATFSGSRPCWTSARASPLIAPP